MTPNNNKTNLKRGLLLLAVTLAILLTSCNVTSASEDNQVQISPEVGEILVYTALQDEQIEGYVRNFNRKYPNIEVNVLRESTGTMTRRIFAEANNPQADVIWGVAATSLLIAEWKEILQAYAPKGLSRVNPRFRDLANPPNWVGIDVWMSAFCVNTEEIKKLNLPTPGSWADLLNPLYKDYIVMPNPNSSGTGFLSISAVFQIWDEASGWEYLDELHENIALYTHSGSKPCKLVGAGEYPIGISFGFQGTIQKESGKPVKTVFPAEGSGWDMEANGLVKKNNIKPAAKTFLDWAISDRAMNEYAQNWAVTAVKTDQPIPENYPSDPTTQMIDNDLPWAAANRGRILSQWLRLYDEKSEPK
ncbi:MAG: putative 2-aminoethylphosphonate ABC transporter substrate-binding protein [Ardenticatenaceae bacterium]